MVLQVKKKSVGEVTLGIRVDAAK